VRDHGGFLSNLAQGGIVTDRKLLLMTTLVSLALHVLLAIATRWIDIMPALTPTVQAAEPTIELMLVPDPAESARNDAEQPTRFTEIPDRLADERPDQADFLAMRDSRARDRLPGGQAGEQPGTEREGEFPQVAIAPENLAGAEGVSVESPVMLPPTEPTSRQRQSEPAAAPPRGAEAAGPGELAVPRPEAEDRQAAEGEQGTDQGQPSEFEDWLAEQRTPSLLRQGERQAPGDRGFDFRQLEQGRIGTSVNLDGDFSLSTYEWNFAPWMRRFANDLHRSWIAPYAYRLGIIDGHTRIRLVVERDGRPSSMEVLERNGHDSLHTASVAALQAFAPYAPLPPDFPEDRLVIHLGLHYPAWRR